MILQLVFSMLEVTGGSGTPNILAAPLLAFHAVAMFRLTFMNVFVFSM